MKLVKVRFVVGLACVLGILGLTWFQGYQVRNLSDKLATAEEERAIAQQGRSSLMEMNNDLWTKIENLQAELNHQWGNGSRLTNFGSLGELHMFLSQVTVDVEYQPYSEGYDCDDFAFALMEAGARAGYLVYPTLEIAYQENSISSLHMSNFVIVGVTVDNEAFDIVVLIEPQSLETWVLGRVDEPVTWRGKWFPFLP